MRPVLNITHDNGDIGRFNIVILQRFRKNCRHLVERLAIDLETGMGALELLIGKARRAAHDGGYGLGLMVEIPGGALSGQGCAQGEQTVESNGVVFTVYNIPFFSDLDWYYDEVEGLINHVKSSRTAPGMDEILIPGEPEFRMAEKKRREGIELDETTWQQIREAAELVGIDPEKWN